MVLSRQIAKANRVGLNKLTRPLAARLGGFGVIEHTGRRSGRTYRTPVNVFPVEDGFVVALTYGSDADWVRNVLAARHCVLLHRGERIPLGSPRLYDDPERKGMPAFVRFVLGLASVTEFLELKRA